MSLSWFLFLLFLFVVLVRGWAHFMKEAWLPKPKRTYKAPESSFRDWE